MYKNQNNMEPLPMRKPKKAKAKDEVKSVGDEKGNLLVLKNNGKRVIVSLRLIGEGNRCRKVGIINLKQKRIEIRRNRAKHLFRKGDSYGVNYKLINDSTLFDFVSITDEFSRWVVPKQFIIDNGKILNFSNAGVGFEVQTFISLAQMEPFKKDLML